MTKVPQLQPEAGTIGPVAVQVMPRLELRL